MAKNATILPSAAYSFPQRRYYEHTVYDRRFKDMDIIALILTIVGSINWGLVALFQFDLVAWIFGGQTATLSRLVYGLVALAGLWCISFLFRKNAVTGDE